MKKIIFSAHPESLKRVCAHGKLPFRACPDSSGGFRGKKIILLLASYFLVLNASFSQEMEWQKCLGGSYTDDARCISPSPDGGCIISGYSQSNDGNVSGNHGSMDMWVVKLDADGNMQWQKCYGGSGGDVAYSIISTNDGGYAIAGNSTSIDGDATNNYGVFDYWVIKIDSSGIIQWQHNYGGSYNEWGEDIIQTSDGGYFVSGESESNDHDVTGHHGSPSYKDIWCVKLNSAGIIEWQKSLGGTSWDAATRAIQTDDGGFVVTGSTYSNNGDVSGFHGIQDVWIFKLDSAGNLQWQKCLGGSSNEWANSIIKHNNDGYILFCSSNSNDGDVSGNHGDRDAWVVRIDTAGNIIWQKSIGATGNDQAAGGFQNADGSLIAGGVSESKDSLIPFTRGGLDYWAFKLDSTGTSVWQKTYGGTEDDGAQLMDIMKTTDGKLIIAATTNSNDIDVSGYHGQIGYGDYWLLKLTDSYNSITGKLFIDANSNGVQDAGELNISNKSVTEINTGRFNFSNQNGDYLVSVLDSGNFSVSPASINYYNAVPANQAAYFNSIHQTDSLNDFAFQSAGVYNDLCIQVTPMSDFSPGFDAHYMISYENVGTTSLNGTVIFFPDNDITYVSADVTPTAVTTDSVIWNVGTLTPFQKGSILITVNVNIGTPVGTFLNSRAEIDPILGDANTECNINEYDVYVTGAVDPNAILVDRDTVFTTELSSPPYLNYIIYFQNTGNDTAFNARVLNNIPQRLDISSFEFVASSHPVNIKYSAASLLMEFDFDNILLPDSNVNETASHGFIRYRIKPKSNLVAGNKIFNRAAIYFDFNQPVLTNYALTEIVLPTGINEFDVQNSIFNLFPNPANSRVSIDFFLDKIADVKIEIFNSFGQNIKTVLEGKLNPGKQQITFDASALPSAIYFVKMIVDDEMTVTKMVRYQ